MALEVVLISLAASVKEWLTLHGGHVEKVASEKGATLPHFTRKTTDLGDFWDSVTHFVTLLKSDEVVGVSCTATIAELLTALGEGIVVKTTDFSSTWTFNRWQKADL